MTLETPWQVAKRLVPKSVKHRLKESARLAALRIAVAELRRLQSRYLPARDTLIRLRFGWGNDPFAAPVTYLERVAEAWARTDGAILECGSGCSTVLLGFLAASSGRTVYTLEHDPAWHAQVAQALAKYSVPGVRLVEAPLADYGDFDWYRLPPEVDWPERFGLVACDGPPTEATRGGRVGLLPVMGDRLAPGTEILLDDAAREDEKAVVWRWGQLRPLTAHFDPTAGRGIATLTLG